MKTLLVVLILLLPSIALAQEPPSAEVPTVKVETQLLFERLIKMRQSADRRLRRTEEQLEELRIALAAAERRIEEFLKASQVEGFDLVSDGDRVLTYTPKPKVDALPAPVVRGNQ
jgi:hypothetical protein